MSVEKPYSFFESVEKPPVLLNGMWVYWNRLKPATVFTECVSQLSGMMVPLK